MTTGSPDNRGNAETITVIGTMKVKPEYEEEFLDTATRLVQTVHEREPATTMYVLHRHLSEPHTYMFVERYRDAQAQQAHQATPYFADAVAKLPEWLAAPPEFEEFGQLAPA